MPPVYHRIEKSLIHKSLQTSRKYPFALAFFVAFRLAYAPVVGFFHTAHGNPWLITGLILLFSFGGEGVRRFVETRSPPRRPLADPTRRQRATILIILALVLLGFTPEEGLVGIILWAAIGLAWADLLPGPSMLGRMGWIEVSGWLAGIGVGLLGIVGPSPWIAAAVIGGIFWPKK